MKIKQWLFLFVMTLFVPVVSAQNHTTKNALAVRYPLMLNGQEYQMKNAMFLVDDYTYLPIREIGELFQMYIAWDSAEKTINISSIGIIHAQETNMMSALEKAAVVPATVSDFSIKVNGYRVQLQQPIVVIQNSAYLPLRQLAELLGFSVDWNQEQRMILMQGLSKPVQEEKEIYLWYSDENESDVLYGLMDKNGHIITTPKYNAIGHFSEGLAVVEKDGNYGYIDKKGIEVIPCKYHYAKEFSEGLAMVSERHDGYPGLFSFINKQGNTVIAERFWNESGDGAFHNGLAPVTIQENGKYYDCYIDRTGEIKAKYPSGNDSSCALGNFQNGYAKINHNIINTAFETVFCGEEYDSFELCDGWIVACKNNRYGVVDMEHQIIIDFQYEKLKPCSEGLFAFCENGLWGYLDINQQIVIPPIFCDASEFFDGKAIVETEPGIYHYIDKTGAFLSGDIHAEMFMIVNDCGLFFVNQKGYFFSETGEMITPKA